MIAHSLPSKGQTRARLLVLSPSTLVMTQAGRYATTDICRVLKKITFAPKGTAQTQGVLEVTDDFVVVGGREDTFTPMFFFVAKYIFFLKNTLSRARLQAI